ncbi:MAG: YtxH domain-containing protein [Cyclobacteriaceae bacterium]
MKTGKALSGVFAGLATGSVLGVIFAPQKGSASRKKISQKGEELAAALDKRIDEKFEELTGMIAGKMKAKPENGSTFNAKSAKVEILE